MTIEFHCPHCDKLLKTPDDKAGVRANCPGCGQTVTVPDPAVEAGHADPSFAAGDPALAPADAVADGDAGGSPDDTKACPMCGATIKKAATRCRFCGETLVHRPTGEWVPTQIDAGDILNRSWEIYKNQLGLLIASVLIAFGIPAAINVAMSMVQQVVILAVGGGPGGGGNQGQAAVLIIGITILSFVINVAVQQFMQAGFTVFLLRVARGETPEIADLFTGAKYFWRFFWGGILLQIILTVGCLLAIVPGVILALMLWPMTYVIVDRDVGVIDALQLSREVTSGNYMAVILLVLAGLGINLLGIAAFCVGVIFSAPLALLLLAVAYCGMTGKLAARPAQ